MRVAAIYSFPTRKAENSQQKVERFDVSGCDAMTLSVFANRPIRNTVNTNVGPRKLKHGVLLEPNIFSYKKMLNVITG
jgi:hypothetical protein